MTFAEPQTLTIQDALQFNAVVWVRSLPLDEHGPSRRITEDLEDLTRRNDHAFILYDVANRTDLASAFRQIIQLCEDGLRPFLVVDAHGDAETGILLAPSAERAPWSEVIESLRQINVATQNNLACLFNLCFGLHLYKLVSLKKAAPAFLFFAPPDEVQVGALEDATFPFFRTLVETGNLATAYEEHLAGLMEAMNCKGLFVKALAYYVRHHCRGTGKAARQEGAVTRLLAQNGVSKPTRAELRKARSLTRTGLKPGPHIITHFAPRFLMGRPPGFTYRDVERLADLMPARSPRPPAPDA